MDLHNNLKFSVAMPPVAAVTNDTAFVSNILDTANFSANELCLIMGTESDSVATFTLLMEESDASDFSGNTAIADADLIGTEAGASFTFAKDNVTKKIGYRGAKRYVRATVTPANNTGNIFLAAAWVQGGARVAPQA